MLTLKLKVGESLLLGDDVRVFIKEDLGGGQVRVSISAPRSVNVERIGKLRTDELQCALGVSQ
ncbi:hypothetical protein RAZWK3B_16710 [Roseobacter sp. AzwK-3b]|uniref:carbon storage regulator n=1 Tax=Roseobacter sp. AzwK-3b TaxID=351016 RepID=UPI00015699B0|nr:carbon storage regulator [Roseobacter sp. AzwK-3b]EDM71057.1 hypothetical protein RAZWK3B_16710 [Roseobacter sp. AzwK-3b]